MILLFVLAVILELYFTSIISSSILVIGAFVIEYYLMYIRAKRLNAFIQRKNEWYETLVDYTGKFCENPDFLGKLEDFMDTDVNVSYPKINYLGLMGLMIAFLPLVLSLIYDYDRYTLALLFVALIAICLFLKPRVKDPILEIPIKKTFLWAGIQLIFNICSELNVLNVVISFSGNAILLVLVLNAFMPVNYLWDKLQKREKKFCDLINEIWMEEGWMTKKIYFFVDPSKYRSIYKWGFLVLFSGGLGLIAWDYAIHTDPDNIYSRFYKAEDEMLEAIVKNNFR